MKITKTLVYILFLLNIISYSHATQNKILFKINNEIITSIDLLNEIEYAQILNSKLSNLPKPKLFEIAKNSLIKQKIRQIETSKYFSSKEFENEYSEIMLKEFMSKANLKKEKELKNFLKSKNIDIKTIIEKIRIEILWNQLILKKFSNS